MTYYITNLFLKNININSENSPLRDPSKLVISVMINNQFDDFLSLIPEEQMTSLFLHPEDEIKFLLKQLTPQKELELKDEQSINFSHIFSPHEAKLQKEIFFLNEQVSIDLQFEIQNLHMHYKENSQNSTKFSNSNIQDNKEEFSKIHSPMSNPQYTYPNETNASILTTHHTAQNSYLKNNNGNNNNNQPQNPQTPESKHKENLLHYFSDHIQNSDQKSQNKSYSPEKCQETIEKNSSLYMKNVQQYFQTKNGNMNTNINNNNNNHNNNHNNNNDVNDQPQNINQVGKERQEEDFSNGRDYLKYLFEKQTDYLKNVAQNGQKQINPEGEDQNQNNNQQEKYSIQNSLKGTQQNSQKSIKSQYNHQEELEDPKIQEFLLDNSCQHVQSKQLYMHSPDMMMSRQSVKHENEIEKEKEKEYQKEKENKKEISFSPECGHQFDMEKLQQYFLSQQQLFEDTHSIPPLSSDKICFHSSPDFSQYTENFQTPEKQKYPENFKLSTEDNQYKQMSSQRDREKEISQMERQGKSRTSSHFSNRKEENCKQDEIQYQQTSQTERKRKTTNSSQFSIVKEDEYLKYQQQQMNEQEEKQKMKELLVYQEQISFFNMEITNQLQNIQALKRELYDEKQLEQLHNAEVLIKNTRKQLFHLVQLLNLLQINMNTHEYEIKKEELHKGLNSIFQQLQEINLFNVQMQIYYKKHYQFQETMNNNNNNPENHNLHNLQNEQYHHQEATQQQVDFLIQNYKYTKKNQDIIIQNMINFLKNQTEQSRSYYKNFDQTVQENETLRYQKEVLEKKLKSIQFNEFIKNQNLKSLLKNINDLNGDKRQQSQFTLQEYRAIYNHVQNLQEQNKKLMSLCSSQKPSQNQHF